MEVLKEIKATPKTGQEVISNEGESINYTLLDFWRWSVSDLISNATRGQFAEFIVGTALGLNPENLRVEWDSHDLKTDEGIKIEVKSASYIQTWAQRKFSTISFLIKPTKHWEKSGYRGSPKRHADVYVFCLLAHQDQETIDPLKMEQWVFYVLPTYRLDNYKRSQTSITLNSLHKLTEPIKYSELRGEILKAYSEQTLSE